MPELLTLQDLANGHLDVKALGEAANGDENTIVTTRTGNTYPSAERAINIMFQNGGLPAEPFATLEKMQTDGTSLADGTLAQVYNETTNNGLYVKEAGAWVKANYDPVKQSKEYTDNTLSELAIDTPSKNLYDMSTKVLNEAVSSDGNIKNFTDWSRSDYIPVVAGQEYTVSANPVAFPLVARRVGLSFFSSKSTTSIPGSYNASGGVVTVTAPPTAQYLVINIDHPDTIANKVQVEAGHSATSYVPFSIDKVVAKKSLPSDTVFSSELQSMTNVINENILAVDRRKTEYNLFKNIALTSTGSSQYEATVANEMGVPTLTMVTSKLSSVFYETQLDGQYIDVGATVRLSAEIFSDQIGALGGDISIQALNSSLAIIATSIAASNSKANEWQELSTTLVLPTDTAYVRTRFIRRRDNTVVKFRKPSLSSDTFYSSFLQPSRSNASNTGNVVFVGKSGSNSNPGTLLEPFLTIQRAVDALPMGGDIKVLDSDPYRESLTIDTQAHIKISPIAANRVNVFGSDKLSVTKTAGYSKVYQAPLATKPVGMGVGRGQPAIFEWGTPSKPIIDGERHYLHRGLSHRLPYTEMNEVLSIAELDTVNGAWYWDAGIIYLSATDGSDASLKRYEARMRPVLTHSNGTVELVRVTSWFSNIYGMEFNGLATKRSSCIVYGALHNGFADNANSTESYKDIAGGVGNDGINGTLITTSLDQSEINSRIEAVYFDPYGHDNGDDGISCHYRSDATIFGGLFEYNTKADVVHVTGANCACYNTEARGTLNGFYTATDPTLDTERVVGVMRCVGTKSTDNDYSYRATSSSIMHCDDAIAINPAVMGYTKTGENALYATNCKYEGDALKAKSGNVIVSNIQNLTP